jgi:hypothetical protein
MRVKVSKVVEGPSGPVRVNLGGRLGGEVGSRHPCCMARGSKKMMNQRQRMKWRAEAALILKGEGQSHLNPVYKAG